MLIWAKLDWNMDIFQKQPKEVLCQNMCSEKFTNSHRKHQCKGLYLINFQVFRPATLQAWNFATLKLCNFAGLQLCRPAILQNICERLLLTFLSSSTSKWSCMLKLQFQHLFVSSRCYSWFRSRLFVTFFCTQISDK